MTKVLVTGALGFIGSHFCKYLIEKTDYQVVGLSRLTDSRSSQRLTGCWAQDRFNLIYKDLTQDISGICEDVDWVVNFAAKTFVDHSIADPNPFVRSNIVGTYNLLEEIRRSKNVWKYIQISTDEVYGSILEGSYKEDSMLNPTNPYSATKAAADMLCICYWNTYKLPIIITRTENNFGEYQHPQKVFPKFVKYTLEGKRLPVYGDGKHTRMWLYVKDHCSAILKLLQEGSLGEIYHVAGEHELQNVELARTILRTLGKPEDQIEFIPDWNVRPGHDRRYALDSSKLRALGWISTPFKEAMIKTVKWYADNLWWLN